MDFEDKNDLNFKANLHIRKSSEFEKPTFSNKVTSTKLLIKDKFFTSKLDENSFFPQNRFHLLNFEMVSYSSK